MCDYEHEYSFTFEDSALDNELDHWDCGFESMWQQIGEELRREQENNDFFQSFEQKLTLQTHSVDSWRL
ncbi:pgc [Drosophila busckii]|uniref:Pgc n=1 Tax=Drosophila busckii TaxID=30019 RepID=A0A0M4EZ58_DROBS|nr:uncharacterized protein LOC108598048 [Drosophila busckii]ALC43620.1 pgc [Drosophila busckii]